MDLDSFLNRSVGDLNNLPREVICNVFSNISHISEIIRIGNKFPQFQPFLRQCVTHVDFRNGNPIFDQDYFSDDETVSLRTLYGILDTFKILKEVKVSLFDVSEKRIISLLTNPIIRDLKIEFNNNSRAEFVQAFFKGLKLRSEKWGSKFTLCLLDEDSRAQLLYTYGATNILGWENIKEFLINDDEYKIDETNLFQNNKESYNEYIFNFIRNTGLEINLLIDTEYNSVYFHEFGVTKIGFRGSYERIVEGESDDIVNGLNTYLTHIYFYSNLDTLRNDDLRIYRLDRYLPQDEDGNVEEEDIEVLPNMKVFQIPIRGDIKRYKIVFPNVHKFYSSLYYDAKHYHLAYEYTMNELKSMHKMNKEVVLYP